MAYTRRNVGDNVNGAILIRRVNERLWEMKCACGNTFVSQPSDTSGRCRECGYKYNSTIRRVHGEAPGNGKPPTRLYSIWSGMRGRCNNPNEKAFKWYGGRGISVCDEWNDYLSFKQWALNNGYNDTLSIDRIDVNGNYCPQNCKWSTNEEQSNNRRNNHKLTFCGKTKTISDWSKITGISSSAISQRINIYGWNVEEALTIPCKKGNNQMLRKKFGGDA